MEARLHGNRIFTCSYSNQSPMMITFICKNAQCHSDRSTPFKIHFNLYLRSKFQKHNKKCNQDWYLTNRRICTTILIKVCGQYIPQLSSFPVLRYTKHFMGNLAYNFLDGTFKQKAYICFIVCIFKFNYHQVRKMKIKNFFFPLTQP